MKHFPIDADAKGAGVNIFHPLIIFAHNSHQSYCNKKNRGEKI